MSQLNASSPAKRVDVIASLPMERALQALNLPVEFRYATQQVSLETQQMDEVKDLDLLAVHHENLRKLLRAEKPTGTPHLFVLDPDRLAIGDIDAQTTLQALASAHFNNPKRSAVAMLPPHDGFTQAGTVAASMIKETYASELGMATLESVAELQQWLDVI